MGGLRSQQGKWLQELIYVLLEPIKKTLKAWVHACQA
jgi:hypothetical protein